MEPWARIYRKYQNIGNKVSQPSIAHDFYYYKCPVSDIPTPIFFDTKMFSSPNRAIFLSSNLPCLRT